MACRFGSLTKYIISTPIGELELSCCKRAVHVLTRSVKSTVDDPNFKPDPSMKVELKAIDGSASATDMRADSIVTQVTDWLSAYFHPSHNLTLPALPNICHLMDESSSDSFNTKVWRALTHTVSLAHTITYGELGVASGVGKQCARAVGGAMRANPVILLVPCHRVVPVGGNIGHYSGGGAVVKRWLLEHEKNQFIVE